MDHLVNAVVHDATGESDGDVCLGEPPSARYYMASLAPNAGAGGPAQSYGRAARDSLGFEFEAQNASEISVKARASFYYAVLPTRNQQLQWAGERTEPYRLAPVFRRLEVAVGPVEVVLGQTGLRQTKTLENEFRRAFDEAVRQARRDPRIDRRHGHDRRERMVPPAAMADEAAFEQWLAQEVIGEPVVPSPDAHVVITSRPVAPGRLRVTATLQNLAADPMITVQGRGSNAGRSRRDEARDHTLFRAALEIEGDRLLPIEMDLGADAYRYSGELGAYANNCGVESWGDGRLVGIRSVPVPVHDTHRAVARTDERWAYDALAADPLPALDALAEAMESYLSDPVWSTADLQDEPELARQKEADREASALEVARFRDGIAWLRRDEKLLLAFRLANESMTELNKRSKKPSRGWRLFQLVSIVSQLGALAWREHPEEEFTPGLWGDEHNVDPTEAATVIWYPTGGGKTEAYLGLVVVCMFYDRIRGKKEGVSAWCRFPLRLLTLQQTQRQLNVVAAAETVRKLERNAARIKAMGGADWPFFIGFYAGSGNTPNSLLADGMLDRLRSSEEARHEYRLVHECPYCCEASVKIPPPDPRQLRLLHVCGNERCGKTLPIIVVDTEIYRYLPTVVVGTLDKLANIGLSDKFGALFGDVDCQCPDHGYGRGGKCHERHAPGHPKVVPRSLKEPLYDPSPSLEIIDELHMVNEELGAFSGHYEGLLAEVQRTLSARQRADGRGVRMKVVATTATIRGEDRQSEHLFGLPSVVVPLPGPSREESFYWKLDRDRPMRRFVGVMPTRGTAEMTLVRMLTSAHRALWKLVRREDMSDEFAGWPAEELEDTVDLYRTSLTYVTSLVDFGKIRRSLDTQVNEALRREGFPDLQVAELKSENNRGLDGVRGVLEDLSTTGGETGMVVATSMASHGVDVDRLNLMLFNGMPRSMAEYIQASSRVGRSYHGLVFMLFNPVRERDRSHYRYHGKFHDYLDRMVEPVAINRWSRFAVRRTLPGILMGQVLQIANRDWWQAGNAPGHLHDLSKMQSALRTPAAGGLSAVQLTRLLETMHAVFQSSRPEGEELQTDLERLVEDAITHLRSAGASAGLAGGNDRGYRSTGDHLGLEYRPMTSLRDVSEGIPFHMVSDGRRS
ncbi:helicase-related protein [Streptomyces sp. NPDC059629]|uniref:helicase-related protein n=1 Tax=Streptomyces sp. NPDC059629 TaxID=3346889 RepID=UPI0036CB3665